MSVNQKPSPYALAFYEKASEEKNLDSVSSDVDFLMSFFQPENGCAFFFNSPALSTVEKIKILKEIRLPQKFNLLTLNWLDLLASKKKLKNLFELLEDFICLSKNTAEETEYLIESAFELDDRTLTEMQLKLKTILPKAKIINKTNPELIAGINIKHLDYQVRSSFRETLSKLKADLEQVYL
jgi:ATP synthase F1 delta subunit